MEPDGMGRKSRKVLPSEKPGSSFRHCLRRSGNRVSADPVVVGAYRHREAVVLSYERYLELLAGRDGVRSILDDRTAAGIGMDEDEAMALALEAQAAVRRGR